MTKPPLFSQPGAPGGTPLCDQRASTRDPPLPTLLSCCCAGSAKSYIRLRFDSSNDRLEALEAVPRIREILRLTIMTDDCGGYYWGPFHPRAQDEPWMAAERERRGRRDERYDPAAVARLWEEGERAREEAGEASAAAASQPAASPRQGAEPERQALSAFFDYPAAQALAGCQASWNPAGV